MTIMRKKNNLKKSKNKFGSLKKPPQIAGI